MLNYVNVHYSCLPMDKPKFHHMFVQKQGRLIKTRKKQNKNQTLESIAFTDLIWIFNL